MIESQGLDNNVGKIMVSLFGTLDRLSQSAPMTHDPTAAPSVKSPLTSPTARQNIQNVQGGTVSKTYVPNWGEEPRFSAAFRVSSRKRQKQTYLGRFESRPGTVSDAKTKGEAAMFVVLGATGHTGSVVAETLLARKQPVRVVVRSEDKGAAWKAKGAEVAVASLDDVSGLTKAFRGASGVYLLVPPNYGASAWLAEQRQRMDQTAESAKANGISHVVFLSSVGGQVPEGTGPIRAARYGEQKLATVAQNLTILRPCYFMENWAPGIGMAKGQGALPTFIAPTAKIPMISTKDIGRVGAEQLLAGGKGKRIVELAGPEDYTPDQVAVVLSQILGRSVAAQHAPLSAVVPAFKSFGVSDEAAKLFEEMYASFSKGAIGYEHPEQLVRGTVSLSEALRGMV